VGFSEKAFFDSPFEPTISGISIHLYEATPEPESGIIPC
jgi:hypothetical protein